METKQASVDDQQQKMDAVLDAALDALDDDEEEGEEELPAKAKDYSEPASCITDGAPPELLPQSVSESKAAPVYGPEEPVHRNEFDEMMKQLMGSDGEVGEAELSAFMNQLETQFASELSQAEVPQTESPAEDSAKAHPKTESNKPVATQKESEDDVDRTISKLLEDMASQGPVSDGSTDEQDMLQDMMKEFEKMGGEFDSDEVIDGMMQQLLSKELMYEPMKQVSEKFPVWLEEHKDTLSAEEFKQRTQQYQCFQQLILVYEQEPNNTEKLMDLMQEVQEFGQPPPEIIKEIAPGLELDSDGIPRLDNMDGLPKGITGEDCSIM